MTEKMFFPKIKNDGGGRPVEQKLPQVSIKEILRAPEDVQNENEIFKSYDKAEFKFQPAGGIF